MTTKPRAIAHPERRRPARRWLRRGVVALLASGALYLATLLRPSMFFSWAYDGTSLRVRSDEAISDGAAAVIALAEARVRRSPLLDPTRSYPVYVCGTGWRWSYFSGFNGHSRAFATPLGRAIFTRRARWGENELVGPDSSNGPRPLDMYLAHETTHMMVADHLGVIAERRLPSWLREGYADYVARHDTFDYEETRARLLAGDEELMSRRRDPYLKYLLLVAHLLDREGSDVRTLLNDPPSADDVEARVRASALSR